MRREAFVAPEDFPMRILLSLLVFSVGYGRGLTREEAETALDEIQLSLAFLTNPFRELILAVLRSYSLEGFAGGSLVDAIREAEDLSRCLTHEER